MSDFEGRIIRLHGDRHQDLQDLLAWFVTGRLDPSEQAEIEAHLKTCADCQAEVRIQRRLGPAIASLPIGVEQGWAAMRRQLETDAAAPARRKEPRPIQAHGWPGLGWAAALIVSLAAGGLLLPDVIGGRYHALGARPAAPSGNLVLIFRPETQERTMREMLNASHARLVDGPTAADAYVLHVPPAERAAVLASLRARADVVLAEPIDPGAGR